MTELEKAYRFGVLMAKKAAGPPIQQPPQQFTAMPQWQPNTSGSVSNFTPNRSGTVPASGPDTRGTLPSQAPMQKVPPVQKAPP